jgi:ribosomal protein L37E
MKTAMEKEPMPAATKARVEKTINLDSFHKLNPEAKPKKACSKCGSTKNDMRGNICDKCAFPKTANVIDVSSLEAPVLVKKASANETALDGKYSLDTFADVQKAVEFFEENYKHFSPPDRREFAVKTAARAAELTIPLTPVLERYGSPDYASDVDSHLASRRALAPDHKEVWNALQEKRASIEPSAFAELLQEADEEAGLNWLYDGEVSDPFFATFGGNKVKEANALWSWKSRTGEVVNGSQLKRLARDGKGILMKQFDNALVSAFMADPLTIFDSLPDTHKMLLARLALGEYDGMPTN